MKQPDKKDSIAFSSPGLSESTKATQPEAEAGTGDGWMSAERTAQAIAKRTSLSGVPAILMAGVGTAEDGYYTERGTADGRPYYNKVGSASNRAVSSIGYLDVGGEDQYWFVSDSTGNTVGYVYSDAATPDLAPWAAPISVTASLVSPLAEDTILAANGAGGVKEVTTGTAGKAMLAAETSEEQTALLSDASTTAKGIIELATDAEVQTGTDTGMAATPSGVAASVLPSVRVTGAFDVCFEGDSMLAPSTAFGYLPANQDIPAVLATLPNFAGAIFHNSAVGGSLQAQQIARYAANIYPYRPAATGRAAAYLFVWSGTTYYDGTSDVDSSWATLKNYLTTAVADGFTPILFTVWRRKTTAAEASPNRKPYFEYWRSAWNRKIRDSGYPVIDTDALVPDTSLTTISPDGTHASYVLTKIIAEYINSGWPSKSWPITQKDHADITSVVSEQIASGADAPASVADGYVVRKLNTVDFSQSGTIQLCMQADYDAQTVSPTYLGNVVNTSAGGSGGLAHFVGAGATGTLYLTNTTGTWNVGNTLSGECNGTLTTVAAHLGAFFLSPGKYRVKAYATGYRCGNHQLYLWNVTNDSVLLTGSPATSNATDGDNSISVLEGIITIPKGSAFLYFQGKVCELRHYTELVNAAGQGKGNASGQVSVPCRLEITKIGMP